MNKSLEDTRVYYAEYKSKKGHPPLVRAYDDQAAINFYLGNYTDISVIYRGKTEDELEVIYEKE